MNKVRQMVLEEARNSWVGIRNARHSTKAEKDLAELAIDETNAMIREDRERRVRKPPAAKS